MIFLGSDDVVQLIKDSPDSPNTRFLSSAHNLWTRFQNYGKSPPMALEVKGKIVSLIFSTFNKNLYTNNYEVVTMAGQETKGYAKKLWGEYVYYAVNEMGCSRLKNSCVPSSIPWHVKNGLIFWAIDPIGSLKTDQPLFPNIEAQVDARKTFLKNPSMALPTPKIYKELWKQQLPDCKFGVKKHKRTRLAIATAGENWLGDWLKLYVE